MFVFRFVMFGVFGINPEASKYIYICSFVSDI